MSREEIAALIFPRRGSADRRNALSHKLRHRGSGTFCGGRWHSSRRCVRRLRSTCIWTERKRSAADASCNGMGYGALRNRCFASRGGRMARHHRREYDAGRPHVQGASAIFENEEAHAAWRRQRNAGTFRSVPIPPGRIGITLGIDSGSTTAKIAAFDDRRQLLFPTMRPTAATRSLRSGRDYASCSLPAGRRGAVRSWRQLRNGLTRISSKRPSDSTRASSRPSSRITLPGITPDVSFILIGNKT